MVSLSNISKHYGSKVLYANASVQLNPGEKTGLVGANGAGKTTIFRIITGQERVDEGYVSVPKDLKISYFRQDIEDMRGRTVIAEVMAADEKINAVAAKLKKFEKQLEDSAENPISDDAMEKLLLEYGKVQEDFEQRGGYLLEARGREILSGLGIPVEDQERMTETFSGGWKMRIALAKVLVVMPDVLLMDEPTNHLDLESIVWLEEWIRNFKGAVLMTSHDREFMNRLVNKITHVGDKTITTYTGDYDFYVRESKIRREQLIASKARQEEMLAKEEEFIARFKARASHAAQVQSRVKKIEKIERIEIPPEDQVMHFDWPQPGRGGDEVIRFSNLQKVYRRDDGAEKLVFEGASALVKRLDRVVVVGVNGAGKSTLLKIIAGHTEPTAGQFQIGPSITVGYFSQNSMDVLNPNNTVMDEVHSRVPHASTGFVKNLLGAFLFSGDEADKKISILSGGEKTRVVIATLMANPPNFLLLDEPTNHLDIKSREVLLTAIQNFPGTVMLVSHDRYFLKAVATRVFELDKSHLNTFDGTYSYYLEKSAALREGR